MSIAINRVTLAGHLVRDPEPKQLGEGRTLTQFCLAINHQWRSADGTPKSEATFVDCDAWGRTGELVEQYLSKGQPCLIEGRLQLNQWEDADGKRQRRLRVVADSVQFLGGRRQNSDNQNSDNHSPQRAVSANQYADPKRQRRVHDGPSLEESAGAADSYHAAAV